MELIEFNETLKQCGIWNPVYKNNYKEDIHAWNNLIFVHDVGGTAIIKGQVSPSAIEIASQKYRVNWDKKLGIGINIWHKNNNQNDITYQFENKEALTLFILATQDIIATKNSLPPLYLQRSNQIITDINHSLITKINNDITIRQWYQKHGIDSNYFFDFRTAKLDILSRLNNFDKSINIFNDEKNLNPDFIYSVNISVSEDKQEERAEADITDIETETSFKLSAYKDQFKYMYLTKDYTMTHTYYSDCNHVLTISDKKTNTTVEYSVMNNEFNKLPITDQQKKWIIEELDNTLEKIDYITKKIYINNKEKTKI